MDLIEVHKNISASYWAANIPFATLKRALENSMCFGVFTEAGEQVGFARVVTDKASFAYLADVYIKQEHRGQGLGKSLVKTILESPELNGLRRFMLATSDAHNLYHQYGFSALKYPDSYMEIWRPDIYKKPAEE